MNLLLVSLCCVFVTADTQVDKAKWERDCKMTGQHIEQSFKQEVERCSNQLNELLKATPKKYLKQRQKQIELYEKQLMDAKKQLWDTPKICVSSLLLHRMQTGDAGYISHYSFKVRQVLKEGQMLVDCDLGSQSSLILFTNVSTTDISDDMRISMEGLYVATGTYTYGTVAGSSKTVLTCAKVSDEEMDSLNEIIRNQPPRAEERKWLDVTGKHETIGILDAFDGKEVTLIKPDKSTVKIPILKLSKPDQKYVRQNLGLDPLPDDAK